MSRLTDLIAKTRTKDADLGRELEREFRALSSRRAFGLNFERHRPENVELPGGPIRKDDKVRMSPDFLFFSEDADGAIVADVVDPHGDNLAESLPKLRGLADFVEKNGEHFRRIEAVAEVGGIFRVLNLMAQEVRDLVRRVTSFKEA